MKRASFLSCVVCGGQDIIATNTLKDHSITQELFKLYSCKECHFLFTQNPPNPLEAGKYYQSQDYISHSDTKEGAVNKIYHVVRGIMLSRKYKLIERLKVGKRLLDIGCGTGYFLSYMNDKGYNTLGVEPDDKARRYGKKQFNLEIITAQAFLGGEMKETFNVISLWHVLEHIYNPVEYFKVISQSLEDNGYLLVALPNHKSFDASYYNTYWAAYDVPRHLWHFSPSTLKRFAKANGFVCVGMRRLPFDSFYNSMLSEQYKKTALGFIKGMFIGFIAYIKGLISIEHSSSLVYILKKQS